MTAPLQGFAFPFRIDPNTGSVATSSEDEKLRQNIVHIIMTSIGERVMRRDYGGGLHRMVHDPNNDVMRKLVEHQVAKALGFQEPRIRLTNIQTVLDGSTLMLRISYVVRRTNQNQIFSVPIGV